MAHLYIIVDIIINTKISPKPEGERKMIKHRVIVISCGDLNSRLEGQEAAKIITTAHNLAGDMEAYKTKFGFSYYAGDDKTRQIELIFIAGTKQFSIGREAHQRLIESILKVSDGYKDPQAFTYEVRRSHRSVSDAISGYNKFAHNLKRLREDMQLSIEQIARTWGHEGEPTLLFMPSFCPGLAVPNEDMENTPLYYSLGEYATYSITDGIIEFANINDF